METLATPFSYQEGKRAYLVDAYPLRDTHGVPRTGLVLVHRARQANDPTTFAPVDATAALVPQALVFPARGGFWLTFAIGLRVRIPADAQQAEDLVLNPLLDELAHHYLEVPASYKGDSDAQRFEKEWTRRCSELELVGETDGSIYSALRCVLSSGAHLAHVRGKSARWVSKPLALPQLPQYPHWKVAMACFPTWEVAYATARRLAAGFPRCSSRNPDPDATTRLLWPVPDAGRYLSFGGPGEWIEREGDEPGRNYKFRLHDDAKMQIETLLVAQIPPWVAQYQLALHPYGVDAAQDALMDLAGGFADDEDVGAPQAVDWLLVRAREDENFMGSKHGWASVASSTRTMAFTVSEWRDRYRVTADLLQTARLPYSALAVLQMHTTAPGWTIGEATGAEKRGNRAPTRVRAHDDIKEETGGVKKHLFVMPDEDKPLRQTGIGIFFGKRKAPPPLREEDSVKEPETKKLRLE